MEMLDTFFCSCQHVTMETKQPAPRRSSDPPSQNSPNSVSSSTTDLSLLEYKYERVKSCSAEVCLVLIQFHCKDHQLLNKYISVLQKKDVFVQLSSVLIQASVQADK